jgi:hypothetical protein
MKLLFKNGIAPWLVAGILCLALLLVVVWHFRQDAGPTQQLAFKASRVDVVGQMQLALASASEAEKSAVLATTDQESKTFADQARVATAEVERVRKELGSLLSAGGTQHEKDLLAQFSQAFANLQRVDDEVLRLAVMNTNLKAYDLLFGPAAGALAEMETALAHVVAKHAESPGAKRMMLMAFGARIGVLHIHAQLSPHIAEENDAKMDQMEASMTKEEKQVREDLDGLAAILGPEADPDVRVAAERFARYIELKARILVLSRENTNVRSLALSLNQKRKAMILCLDALDTLKQAVLDEPVAGVTYGRPARPR